jgi:hypothetical protein
MRRCRSVAALTLPRRCCAHTRPHFQNEIQREIGRFQRGEECLLKERETGGRRRTHGKFWPELCTRKPIFRLTQFNLSVLFLHTHIVFPYRARTGHHHHCAATSRHGVCLCQHCLCIGHCQGEGKSRQAPAGIFFFALAWIYFSSKFSSIFYSQL